VKQKMFDVTTAFLAGAGAASLPMVFLWYSFSIKRRAKAEAISVA
jgi:hypothetical protein